MIAMCNASRADICVSLFDFRKHLIDVGSRKLMPRSGPYSRKLFITAATGFRASRNARRTHSDSGTPAARAARS